MRPRRRPFIQPRGSARPARGLVWLGLVLLGVFALSSGGPAGAQSQVPEASLTYRLSETWVSQPPPPYIALDWPEGHEVGGIGRDPESGYLLATDLEDHSIRVFMADGRQVRQIGRRGFGPGQLSGPRDVDGLPGGQIAISDTGNDRVQVLAADGTPVASWPVNAPWGLEVVRDWVYVLSRADRKVYGFSADGSLQRTIDLAERSTRPEGLSYRGDLPSGDPTIRPAATFAVADPAAGQVFGVRDGSTSIALLQTSLSQVRAAIQWVDGQSLYWVSALGQRGIALSFPSGDLATELPFEDAFDVEAAGQGEVYASVLPDGLIRIPDLQYLLARETDTFGRLLQPRAIAADRAILIGDGAPRAQVWDRGGSPQLDIRFDVGQPPLLPEEDVSPPDDVAIAGARRYALWRSNAIRALDPERFAPAWEPAYDSKRWLTGLSARGERLASFDLGNQEVLLFDAELNQTGSFSLAGLGFSGSMDLALAEDRVFLVDRHTYRLTIWSLEGELLATREMAGRPERVAAGPEGRAFVLTRAGWVLAFSGEGEPEGAWSVADSAGLPSDLAVDDAGRLYVSDLAGEIRVYDQDPDAPSGLPQLGDASRCGAIAFKSAQPTLVQYGEPVEVQLVVDGVCPDEDESVDVVLTIDRSGSMYGRKLQVARQAAIDFVLEVDGPRSRVGVTTFSNGAEEQQPLSEDRAQVIRSIANLQAGGSTNVVEGLSQARQTMMAAIERAGNAKVIVFLSDGRHSIGAVPLRYLDDVIAGVRRDGIRVFTIGLGADADRDTLKRIATDDSHFYYSPTEDELETIYAQIAGRITASPLFTDLTLIDVVPENMDYLQGTGRPVEPAWDPAERTLTWELGEVLEPGFRLTYQLAPTEDGLWPTNVEAYTDHVDGRGEPGRLVFPVPYVRVIGAPTPSPTPTPTDTPTPTPTPPDTPSPTPTDTPTPTPTDTPTPTPTPTDTPTPTPTQGPIYLPFVTVDRCVPQWRKNDIVLIIDSSSSMEVSSHPGGPSKRDAAVAAASAFVTRLNFPNEHVAVVQFNADAAILTDLTGDVTRAWSALNRVSMTPGTAIDTGLEAARQILTGPKRRPDATPVVVLLTDGRPTFSSAGQVIIAAERLKTTGATLFTIGLGPDVDPDLLMLLASRPSFYYFAPGTDELTEVYEQIARQLPCEGLRSRLSR